ncbi:amidophosphoribosyltransferase [Enterococcus ratti]|uniref:amidophosphoribosyltransferase n=1 Tax=Enterococcus ratti TaxID=150033 RepID=UPI0009003921|nr:amidophosphoribosyltransferase [Enterococcus ratti]
MSYEVRSLNEECGIFGVWGHQDASSVTYFGLHSLQHRGQEGAGIVSNNHGKLSGYRDLGLLSEVFKDQRKLTALSGQAAIGHVRYATAGNGSVDNIQPFLFKFYDQSIGLAHNGNLTNARSLRKSLEKEGAIFHSNSDTEILMHLIRRSEKATLLEKLKEALNEVKGGFAYLLLTENVMIAALDPNGFRPLAIGQMKNGAYVIASETCALEVIGAHFIRDVRPGEVIVIDDSGYTIDTYTKETQLAICSMEYIYFARPDSNIAGVNVHTARKNMGRNLAKEAPVEADMVVGVPNSSLSAASGYAETSGIPYEIGLVKNQYIARTFIQPTPALREQGVRMKLSAVRGVVEGKKIVMVDDSIVRGTTSRRIVRLLKEAGAKEVHVRIASPPLKYPCFYGIDIQTRKELIAANHSVEEIRQCIEADSLEFLSEEGLIDAIGLNEDAPYSGLCMAYFNGDYPTSLYDYEEKYRASLKEKVSFFNKGGSK